MASASLARVYSSIKDANPILPKEKENLRVHSLGARLCRNLENNLKQESKPSVVLNSKGYNSGSQNSHFKLSSESSSIFLSLVGLLGNPGSASAEDIDGILNGLDNVAASVGDNVPLIVGGIAILSIPIAISSFLNRKGYAGDLLATDAFALLENDNTFLIDIRSKRDKDTEGYPSLQSLRKKAFNVAFTFEETEDENDPPVLEDPSFVEKFSSLKAVEPESTIILIDSFGKVSPIAAKDLTKSGYKKSYVIIGGTEGPSGWRESELPWKEPFRIDLNGLSSIASSIDTKEITPLLLTLAAATGLSIAILSEAEIVLQLLGSAAVIQFLLKKFVFSEDRKKTLEQIKSFVDEQIAPAEIVEDLKGLGSALLPEIPTPVVKPVAAPVPIVEKTVDLETPTVEQPAVAEEEVPVSIAEPIAEVIPSASPEITVGKPLSEDEISREEKDTAVFAAPIPEVSPEPVPSVLDKTTAEGAEEEEETNGAAKSKTEAPAPTIESSAKKSTDIPPSSTPLSPYTMYPDLKPPASPTPNPPKSP